MATSEDIMQVLTVLTGAYPEYDLTEHTIKLWKALFRDDDADLLKAAALKHIDESKWWPKPAEIRQAMYDIHCMAHGRETPEEAWEKVVRAVQTRGVYRQPKFANPLIQRAVDAIGWRNLCTTETPGVERAHFFKVYGAFVEREQKEERLLPAVAEVVRKLTDQMAMRDPNPALPAPDAHDGLTPETEDGNENMRRLRELLSGPWRVPTQDAQPERRRSWLDSMTPEERQLWDEAQRKIEQYRDDASQRRGEQAE